MTSLTLTGAVNDTNSAPYVDYTTDTAYVGSDNGLLFKVKDVFCQTIASPAANSTCATAQPSLDGSWTTNPVTVAADHRADLTRGGHVSGHAAGVCRGFKRCNRSAERAACSRVVAATGAGAPSSSISPGRRRIGERRGRRSPGD